MLYVDITRDPRSPKMGCCNQFYALSGAMDYAMEKNIRHVVSHEFLMDIFTEKRCPLDQILDIRATNEQLSQHNLDVQLQVISPIDGEKYPPSPRWQFGSNRGIFFLVMQCLVFHSSLLRDAVRLFPQSLSPSTPVNILHLRLEKDVLDAYSEQNTTPLPVLQRILEETYIRTLRHFFSKDIPIIILSAEPFNQRVVAFLDKNGYQWFTTTPKISPHREINAIYDLIVNDTFGNHRLIGMFDSTFTYMLMMRSRGKDWFFRMLHYTTPGVIAQNLDVLPFLRLIKRTTTETPDSLWIPSPS